MINQGTEYKSKSHEFEKVITLPGRVKARLKVAVGGKEAPLERVRSYGWEVVDGPEVTLTPRRYRRFIVESRGELSVAKQVYVAMRSGWFSCRSACYLAAGRPVVVQDTGFSHRIPTGEGILTFACLKEAAEAIIAVEAEYHRHKRQAQRVAEIFFDSDVVLSKLLKDAGAR